MAALLRRNYPKRFHDDSCVRVRRHGLFLGLWRLAQRFYTKRLPLSHVPTSEPRGAHLLEGSCDQWIVVQESEVQKVRKCVQGDQEGFSEKCLFIFVYDHYSTPVGRVESVFEPVYGSDIPRLHTDNRLLALPSRAGSAIGWVRPKGVWWLLSSFRINRFWECQRVSHLGSRQEVEPRLY